MASRRIISKDETDVPDFPAPAADEKSDISPAVPAHVIYKLLGFTLAMVVCPLGAYFLTLDLLFRGNSTFAGATAAIVANVVLIGYIVVAFKEDQSEAKERKEKKEKKKL